MSAKAWYRRRRNKYLTRYMNYIDRHPDRALILGNTTMLSREGVIDTAIDYLPLGRYKRAEVFQVVTKK